MVALSWGPACVVRAAVAVGAFGRGGVGDPFCCLDQFFALYDCGQLRGVGGDGTAMGGIGVALGASRAGGAGCGDWDVSGDGGLWCRGME